MDNRDKIILSKILREIEEFDEIVLNSSFESFLDDKKTQLAAGMLLINIGELANHLTKKFKEETKEIPLYEIIAMRHHAAHGYRELKPKIIWTTLKEDIPKLKQDITKLLGK